MALGNVFVDGRQAEQVAYLPTLPNLRDNNKKISRSKIDPFSRGVARQDGSAAEVRRLEHMEQVGLEHMGLEHPMSP